MTELRRAFALDEARARIVLGAVRAVLEVDGVRERGDALLTTLAVALDVSPTTRACTVAEIREAFAERAERRVLVDALIVPACIECEVTRATERFMRGWARELATDSHWVDLLGALRRRSVFAVKRKLVRRAPDARRILRRTWDEDGWAGVWMVMRYLVGRYRDPELARRFHALASLPEGSVGRMFFDHFATRGLAFPGEAGGLPERMVHHDLMHVVNGYGTDPAGECELAGFYAGCADGDAFTFIVIALATFHLGLAVSPAVVTPARGAFDPARVLPAVLRGRRVELDIMGPWDYWSIMPLTLGEARHVLATEPS